MQHNSNNTHTVATHPLRQLTLSVLAALSLTAALAPAHAQSYPITEGQKATASQVAEKGIPLSELSPNAPDVYTVKRGDTLWAISGMYLVSPWRWPELWGMNKEAITNPHRIYPGQVLYLEKKDGYARLSSRRTGTPDMVRLSPRTRDEGAADLALPTLKMHLIEPFFVEPLVVDEASLGNAPRIVATVDDRVLMVNGDRIYARSTQPNTLWATPGQPRNYRMFRNAVPLKDPETGAILGYEASYLGKAELVRSDKIETLTNDKGEASTDYIPATLDITATKEEVRAGDRLLPAPAPTFKNFVPHSLSIPVDARVVSLYGSNAAAAAGQNQVIVINKGARDGMEPGAVLSIWTKSQRIKDKTDPELSMIRLPSEQNGMGMVFRVFDRVSYVLLLEVRNSVHVGDQLKGPR